jgi:hypothetical protein
VAERLVYVPVGGDRFRAQMIAETCKAEGLRVELLTADESGVDPVMGRIQGFRLLVAAGDTDRVRGILGRLGN